MKGKTWVLMSLVVVAVAIVVLVMLRGTAQTVYGNSATVADCQAYVKNNLCTEGYACHACADKGNGWFGADCNLGQSSVPSAQNICLQSYMVTAHATRRCVGSAVYYFDSNGVKNDLYQSCSNGCTDITLAQQSGLGAGVGTTIAIGLGTLSIIGLIIFILIGVYRHKHHKHKR